VERVSGIQKVASVICLHNVMNFDFEDIEFKIEVNG
jgi:hypothetical protein